MSSSGAGYDLSCTTYSPDGRVFQVEYAHKAVEKAGTAVGVRCRDGVVLGVEKLITSKMLVEGSNRRIMTVDLHAGMALTGIAADGRQLVNKARSEARSYKSFYGSAIPGKVLSERVAGFMHMHTLYWYLRPFGSTAIIASYDDEGPELYMSEPQGTSYKYYACAVGKQRNGAKTELEKIKFETVTCREAVMEIAKIIYKLHDDVKDKAFELELSWVCDESKRKHVSVPADLRESAIKAAVAAKERAEMADSDDDDDGPGKKPKAATGAPAATATTTAPAKSTSASSASRP